MSESIGAAEHRRDADRHRNWWAMTTYERTRVLNYEAGYDDGYEQAVTDIANAWTNQPYCDVDTETQATNRTEQERCA